MSSVSVTHFDDVPVHELPGNTLRGLATPSRGSTEIMLWNHRAEAGGSSPSHWHDRDQVIYVLSGTGRVVLGGRREFSGGRRRRDRRARKHRAPGARSTRRGP